MIKSQRSEKTAYKKIPKKIIAHPISYTCYRYTRMGDRWFNVIRNCFDKPFFRAPVIQSLCYTALTPVHVHANIQGMLIDRWGLSNIFNLNISPLLISLPKKGFYYGIQNDQI